MSGVHLIENAHIGQIPETPLTPNFDRASIKDACELIVKFGLHYGIPTGYKQEQNGQLVHSIAPNPATETAQISSSSKVTLELHTETAFHPYKPSHLILMCLRGDKNALTTFCDVDHIIEELDDETVGHLTRNAYMTSVDDSFRSNGEADQKIRMPILSEQKDGSFNICYDRALMVGLDEDASKALDKLNKAIPKRTSSIALKSGDVLIIDNKKTIHGRLPFTPRYDGTDRWLLRLLVIDRLPPMTEQYILGHMVITTDFSKPVFGGEHPYNFGRK